MEDIKITRCPSCGSVHLEGVYDNSGTKKVGKKMIISTLLGFGLIGAISSAAEANLAFDVLYFLSR